jgi:hypothetical protein
LERRYADQLGSHAVAGVSVVCRQTLQSSGGYPLIEAATPLPDYYVRETSATKHNQNKRAQTEQATETKPSALRIDAAVVRVARL